MTSNLSKKEELILDRETIISLSSIFDLLARFDFEDKQKENKQFLEKKDSGLCSNVMKRL